MSSIASLIIDTVTVPIKLFRAIMTLFQLLWAILFITIIVIIVMYWDEIKNKVNEIINGIENIQSKIDEIESKLPSN